MVNQMIGLGAEEKWLREQLAHFAYDLFRLNENEALFAPFPLLSASSRRADE